VVGWVFWKLEALSAVVIRGLLESAMVEHCRDPGESLAIDAAAEASTVAVSSGERSQLVVSPSPPLWVRAMRHSGCCCTSEQLSDDVAVVRNTRRQCLTLNGKRYRKVFTMTFNSRSRSGT